MASDEPFSFSLEHDGSLSLESAIFQALGAASVCWEKIEDAGIFQSEHAQEIGKALLAHIHESMIPRLKAVPNWVLLDELQSRNYVVTKGAQWEENAEKM